MRLKGYAVEPWLYEHVKLPSTRCICVGIVYPNWQQLSKAWQLMVLHSIFHPGTFLAGV